MLCKLPHHTGQAAVPTGELVFPVSGPLFKTLTVKPDPRVSDPLIRLSDGNLVGISYFFPFSPERSISREIQKQAENGHS